MEKATGRETEINFRVKLDDNNLPDKITWNATDGQQNDTNECKAIMIALWDKEEKNTMRIDLWTKDMPIDEMHTYFLQNLMTLTDSYFRATNNPSIKEDMLAFCKDQADKIRAFEAKRNGAQS